MSMPDPPIIVDTGPNPTASIIWLHGLGADGHDFEAIVPELQLPAGLAIRFIFPHAPHRPVTLNGGYVMRAWYDVYSLELGSRQDREGLEEARRDLDKLIAQEQGRGVPSERIVLMGFSQGGALALYAGLRQAQALAGIGALSTYLPLRAEAAKEASSESRATPIFMAHGQFDPVVRFEAGSLSRDQLLGLGYSVEWHEYPMEHSLCGAEIEAISTWLSDRLQ